MNDRLPPALPQVAESRWRSRRERAAELEQRMLKFSAIYNAAYHVRASYFLRNAKLQEAVARLASVVLEELPKAEDQEACLFAIADALYCSPHGVPWEA